MICLTEVQRFPQKSLTSLEEHPCHRRNVKYLGVAQIKLDLAQIPCIGSRTIPCSPSYTTSGLLPLGNYQNSLRDTSSVYRNTNFSTGTRGKIHAPHIVSKRELIPRILLNSKANFKQAPQEEPSFSNRYVRGTLSFLPQVERIPRFPD